MIKTEKNEKESAKDKKKRLDTSLSILNLINTAIIKIIENYCFPIFVLIF